MPMIVKADTEQATNGPIKAPDNDTPWRAEDTHDDAFHWGVQNATGEWVALNLTKRDAEHICRLVNKAAGEAE